MTDERLGAPAETTPDDGTVIDTTVPHSARIWNYWLGGKDNYPVDREAGDAVPRDLPRHRRRWPGPSRAFLPARSRYLAGEAGIRQFLDIGTGLPTADNTHEVAQRVAPAVAGSSTSTTTPWCWRTPARC